MTNTLKALALTLAVTAAPMAAFAEREGMYVGINGQGVFFEDTNLGPALNQEFDPGVGIGLAGGYGFGNGLRAELELAYRFNDFEVTSPVIPGFKATGDVDSMAYMANVYYDINYAEGATFVPYVGGGLGVTDVDGISTEFSYQLMTGVAMNVGEQSQVYTGYRYFSVPGGVDLAPGATMDYNAHALEIGFRNFF
ncbi:MAG: outer membrane protein [Rickettsiales bacterium]|jgi:opacity protein-like surface antigen|nr:outer membrane protein [Rickettsiales bacterium]